MKLGKLQTAWVEALEANPEQQLIGSMGTLDEDGNEKYCCLGKASCIIHGKSMITKKGLFDSRRNNRGSMTEKDRKAIGLRDRYGSFTDAFNIKGKYSLVSLNDKLYTWPQIAKFIRENPEKVFTKSV